MLSIVTIVTDALYFFIPAYVANTCACLLGAGRPLDLGNRFLDGRRILGDGVTIRGSAIGILSGVIAGLLLSYLENNSETFELIDKITLPFLLSTGAIAGDAAGSFIKRRLNIARGAQALILDQLNFVIGGLLFASIVYTIKIETILVLLILTPIGHRLVNFTGYHLKLKDVPW
mgnify:CR=1 FL=1